MHEKTAKRVAKGMDSAYGDGSLREIRTPIERIWHAFLPVK
jgi:hypothetical protein